jgi:hypothetical protein
MSRGWAGVLQTRPGGRGTRSLLVGPLRNVRTAYILSSGPVNDEPPLPNLRSRNLHRYQFDVAYLLGEQSEGKGAKH